MQDNGRRTLDELPDVLTVEDIAKYLRCGRSKAYELTKLREFPAIRIGKLVRIRKDKFIEWLEKQG
jgi:excisionase family DNA binding protein